MEAVPRTAAKIDEQDVVAALAGFGGLGQSLLPAKQAESPDRGSTQETQRYQAKGIRTCLPVSASMAWRGVLKPRHFLGVRL